MFEHADKLLQGRKLFFVHFYKFHGLETVSHVEADVNLNLGVSVGKLDNRNTSLVQNLKCTFEIFVANGNGF